MADFKLYLTSLEPDIGQSIFSQSIGGYISNTLLYPETTLDGTVSLYDERLVLNTPSSGLWDGWTGINYISVNNEIIKVDDFSIDSNNKGIIDVSLRGYNNTINMHKDNDIVRAMSNNELFNDVFNEDRKQYRCLAAKNDSFDDPSGERKALNASIYVDQDSLNSNVSIKIAAEIPGHQYIRGSASTWNTMTLTDSSLAGRYIDNIFNDSYIRITSASAAGQGRIINSFDSSTGTITFVNSLSSTIDFTEDAYYEILPAPAQRVSTGIKQPTIIGDISNFVKTSPNSVLSLGLTNNISGATTSDDFFEKDLFYIWIERTVTKGASSFIGNSIVIDIQYTAGD